MVVGEANINNIMGGIENTGSVRLHNHKRKLKQRFDIIKKLGQGTYGKVQLGINKETGQEVAIKTIKKSKIETEADLIRIRREIQIMSSVQHPNIIHIYEVFENREKMVLVMEYAAGGELYDYLSERKVLVEEEARRIFRQISTACYYCHKHKICHRDLKLENILLDENRNAKIADFGLSNVFDDTRLLSTFCGSPLYASPEIVKGTPYHGPEVDCWSLGVLLYTLVYGAMPFDGSNFKRLVKQISQGDYFEPKTPSPASPLIQEMLTVNPKHRANIEKICAHWWVNEGYDESCLEISEELANQTPVRLDVLLSLNPPPSQLESDKLVVTGEVNDEQMKAEPAAPARSQSVGSLMDISNPAERRIKDLIAQEGKGTPKRKLETTVSSDQANVNHDGKRKEKIVKEHTVADISVQNNHSKPEQEDVKMAELMHEEKVDEITDPSLQGAACAEIIEEAKKNEAKKPIKVKKAVSTSISNKILEEINENPSQESLQNHVDHDKNKENTVVVPTEPVKTEVKEEKEKETKVATTKKKVPKKKVLGDKNEIADKKEKTSDIKKEEKEKEKEKEVPAEPPTKPVERRQSRIFEQAEKFQNRINNSSESKIVSPEKPKKIIIPGVSVGGFKKEFERKASLKSVSPPKLKPTTPTKKVIIDDKQPSPPVEDPKPEPEKEPSPVKTETKPAPKVEPVKPELKEIQTQVPLDREEEHKVKLKNAVSIISNALDKEGARKSKSRPCMTRKPPVPFGTNGRSASGSIGMISSPISPPPDNKRFLKMQTSLPADSRLPLSSTPEQVRVEPEAIVQPESKTSSAEITLKSATLPRRKSTKAEIQLDYPKPKPATMEFKTEMAHQVQAPPSLTTQRSEVMFPVNAPPHLLGLRSSSVEPESRASHKERIIPIAFERPTEIVKEPIMSPPPKPPVPRGFQTQRSTAPSSRSNSLSRQSTQESDSETTVSGEPIKKLPREYIIPIAVEGGGYVTPRAGSLEPSDTSSTVTNSSRKTTGSKFGRPKRMMSLFDRDGSEDESPFGTLHRYSSFGKDSDTEGESRKDAFHMHRLRSSKPKKPTMEHADSLSSGEDEDDDDAFEFLTAENLFSTLLSRVRDLTQRLNVDDGSRPGFPKSRLLSHGSNFWNRMEPMGSSRNSPLGRQFSREHSVNSSSSIPWRRSVSRDLASDIESVFSDPKRTPSATLPRGDKTDDPENLNLSDLNLKKLKLTEEDALALSYLTPGLSRRIQKQLFASLPPSEARKISRTMSMRNEGDSKPAVVETRRSVDRISSTLPRKFSFDKCNSSQQNLTDINQNNETNNRSYLPTSSAPYNERPRGRYYQRASSLREPADFKSKFHTYSLRSPDSSISELSSLKDDESYSYGPETTSLSKYLHGSHLLDTNKEEAKPEINKPARKVSRFLRPDFYDTPKEDSIVVKEKKEREMETQKVLKEIRDKRIRNRLTMRRERSLSQEKALEEPKTNGEVIKCKDLVEALKENETDKSNSTDLLKIVSDNIKNIESNVMSAQKDVKKERVSKLVRPKSYPAENGVVKESKPQETKSKIGKVQKKPTSQKTKETDKSTKNKFLQSIEKKIEKLRTFSNDEKKEGGVENTIKRLREQSVPRNVDHITESTLIKRAVSVEDFSNVKSKALQPSRKSVTKILSLFKKYEDKKDCQLENGADPTVMLKNINESNIPSFKSKIPAGRDVKSPLRDLKSPERERPKSLAKSPEPKSPEIERPRSLGIRDVKSPEKERPKSLVLDKKRCNGTKEEKKISKLPVNSFRKSLNLDIDTTNNNIPEVTENGKTDRKNLKLDFSNLEDVNLNRISYTTDESSNLLSPCDETLSCDSWSVCSDYHHTQDLLSPLSPNGNMYNSGDENESVIDRIRRKSFYTRFNEKKKPRKALMGNYKDLDLYKDYNQKTAQQRYKTPDYTSSYRRNSGYSSSGEAEHDYKRYVRSKSVANDYGNAQRYQTFNPRRSNITSLYSPEDGEDLSATGTYRKYSYNPNRLGNYSRASRSPSSDFQYIPHPHMSEHSSLSPNENSHNITEHAV